jgi:putative endonuclease
LIGRGGGIGRRTGSACRQTGSKSRKYMYYTYAIESTKQNYIYVGITNNTERRIDEHNKGYNKTTKPYTPFKTILIEKYENRLQARTREKFLKSGCGKEYLKQIRNN